MVATSLMVQPVRRSSRSRRGPTSPSDRQAGSTIWRQSWHTASLHHAADPRVRSASRSCWPGPAYRTGGDVGGSETGDCG